MLSTDFWSDKQFHPVSYFRKNINDIITNRERVFGNKKLFEEVCPIVIIAEYLQASEIMFSNSNDSFDAILKFSDKHKKYIECTCAKNGAKEILMREHIAKYRFVSFNLPICSFGTKHNRCLKKQTTFLADVEENATEEALKLINMAIVKKKEKSKTRNLYKGAILIIVLSSTFSYQQDVIKKLKDRIYHQVWDITPFENIYLITDAPKRSENFFIKL